MPKQLILVRHAKSDWEAPASNDFMRPVSARGKHDSPKMGETFVTELKQLDAVFCSPAVRTRQTADLVFQCLPESERPTIFYEASLYLADMDTLWQLLMNVNNALNRVMFIGHNNGLSDLASALANVPFHESIPTSSWVILTFPVNEWSSIGANSGQLVTFAYPKQYPWHYR